MNTRTLPTSIIVRRNDRRHDRTYTPQESSRLPVVINPHTAPKPVDDTAFFGVGRDAQHAWPHRWLYQALAINDKLSIRATESEGRGLVAKVPSALVVGMPVGAHIPARERVNIDSPEQTAYGSLTSLRPNPAIYPFMYSKLGRVS